jgi:hypothetical protein
MRTISSAFVALWILAGISAPLAAQEPEPGAPTYPERDPGQTSPN